PSDSRTKRCSSGRSVTLGSLILRRYVAAVPVRCRLHLTRCADDRTAAVGSSMKSLGLILSYLSGSHRRRNTRLVVSLVGVLIVLVGVFSTIFHVLMAREAREYSWSTGIYWTLTVM